MSNDYAPIAVFTYNRPDHTFRVLSALDASALAPKSDLYIFCDNYKNEKAKESVNQVRLVVDDFSRRSRFKRTEVIKSETNKGLATSIIDGVSEIMKEYGKAIVVEDDMLASPHFLEFMNDALDFYKDNQLIWSISGYSFPIKILEKYPHDVYMAGRGCCWGWGSWIDRWNLVDWDVSDYPQFKHNWVKRFKFGRWGRDLPIMLDNQMYSNHQSWAIRWCYSEFTNKMLTVYPSISYIQNIGNDGSGVHESVALKKYDTVLENNERYCCRLENLGVNNALRKEFAAKYYMNPWKNFKQEVRWLLIRLGIIKV